MRCGAPFPSKCFLSRTRGLPPKTGKERRASLLWRFAALQVVLSCSRKITKAAVTTVLGPGTQKKVKYMWDMDTVLVSAESPVLGTVPGT